MAARRSWLLRLPEIRQELTAVDAPVLDRPAFERLFHIRRRRAIQLMHFFGGYQSSQAFLIDRAVLLQQVEALEAGTEFAIEQARKQRLIDSIEKVRKQRAAAAVRIPVLSDAAGHSVASLPEGIRLEAGSLRVDFDGAEDLLGKLFSVAQAAADDFEVFRAAVDGSGNAGAGMTAAAAGDSSA